MAKKSGKNLSYIGENIKKIRQARKLSQADLSKLFNLARASVGAYEEGRSEPKIETLIAMANYFGISIDALLTRKLTITEIFKFNQVNEKLDQVHNLKGQSLKNDERVKLVRADHYLDYLVQRSNADYLDSLEEVGLPSSEMRAAVAFEMNGTEMVVEGKGLRPGDVLFGKEIDTQKLKSSVGGVVAVATDSELIVRRLEAFDKKSATLAADDSAYPVKTIEVSKIVVCWQIVGAFTHNLPKASQMEDRLLRIEEELKKLKKG